MSTKVTIVNLADRLIRSRGYHGFSYADISSRLKIKNAAIHYHFPKKTDLGVAVIHKSQEQFKSAVNGWKNLSPKMAVAHFLQLYAGINSQKLVCFVGVLGPVSDTLPEPMQEALRTAQQDIRHWLIDQLEKGMEQGGFRINVAVGDKAEEIINLLVGTLITDKINGTDAIKKMIDNIKQTLI